MQIHELQKPRQRRRDPRQNPQSKACSHGNREAMVYPKQSWATDEPQVSPAVVRKSKRAVMQLPGRFIINPSCIPREMLTSRC